MKRAILGSIVGALLIFIWQTLSWTVLDLHRPAQDYTPRQDSIMAFLSGTLTEGGYMMPMAPKGASMEEMTKKAEESSGKPWASIQYHQSLNADKGHMFMNMARGYLTNVIMVWLLCWILSKWSRASFGNVFLACLFTGVIVFINSSYTYHIWYETFDVNAHLLDALASWSLCGVWLGYWLGRKQP